MFTKNYVNRSIKNEVFSMTRARFWDGETPRVFSQLSLEKLPKSVKTAISVK